MPDIRIPDSYKAFQEHAAFLNNISRHAIGTGNLALMQTVASEALFYGSRVSKLIDHANTVRFRYAQIFADIDYCLIHESSQTERQAA